MFTNTPRYSISLGKTTNGHLSFASSNSNGKIIDISDNSRSELINIPIMIKKFGIKILENIHIIKHPFILKMARLEDKSVDALYLKKNKESIIIIDNNCELI